MTSKSPIATTTTGAVNWAKYHEQRATGYRSVAETYWRVATILCNNGDTDFGCFCIERAIQNEAWAEESDKAAQRAAK